MINFEEFRQLMIHDRSVRRFDGHRTVAADQLTQLVELTRYCASGRNMQPLRYRIVTDPAELNSVFDTLKWAGYLPEWDGPEPDERPTGYIIQCLDTNLTNNCMCDDGLHLQTMTLGAETMGLACCVIKAFDVVRLREALKLDPHFSPLYVLTIGYPVEKVEIVSTDGSTEADIRYYRKNGIHFVPKRPLSELIIKH